VKTKPSIEDIQLAVQTMKDFAQSIEDPKQRIVFVENIGKRIGEAIKANDIQKLPTREEVERLFFYVQDKGEE
jgi:hypothetical protein